jgi:phenylalanyl-tRNA synthetase beta subunit
MNLRADIVRGEDNEFALYEINKVFNKVEKDNEELPLERYDLALVFAADAKTANRKYSGSPYFLVKNYLRNLSTAKNLDYYSLSFEPLTSNDAESNPWLNELSKMFEPKRSAIIRGVNGQIYGIAGEFNSSAKRQLKLPDFCAGFEIDDRLFKDNPANPKYEAIPNFPKVEQDISLKSPKKNSYSEVYDAVWSALNELKPVNTLPVMEPIDIFEPEDHKDNIHITLRLWISAFDRTLRAEEVNKLLDDVAEQVKDKLGVERISSSSVT